MRKKAKVINVVVVDCRYVEEGSSNFDGRDISWKAGSRIFAVAEGEKEVKKYKVNPNVEKKVAAFFEDAPFGIYCTLSLDVDGLVIDVKAGTA